MSAFELAAVAACGLPLCAAVANGLNALTGERLYGHVNVARVAVTTVFAAFAASLYLAVTMVTRPGTRQVTIYRFLQSGDFSVDFGFLLDPLSVVMMLVVTGISALVTRFSVNYMHNEDGFTRYFTVVSLFVFAMLVLVMADSYLVMFLGWEGVGVCSYLLISFYRERPASAQAGTKAFVMNRVGDADLLIAMFVLVAHTGTLAYGEVFAQASSLPRGVVEAVGFLLLLGATGKSAQLPLGTWLARAMEGPTPSSALMHAATMVTAGVYLVVRSAPIYDQAPTALIAVGIVGALTALYGQLVGYVQTDIKGMLAASTTAQLGLMFLFCGLGLYAVAIFHLVAHAFYKSYLFLTAPSILHHLHGGPDPTAARRPADTARLLAAVAMAAAMGLLAAPLVGRVLGPAGGPTGNVWVVLALAVIATFAAVFSTRRITVVAFAGHTGDDGRGVHEHLSHQADQASRTPKVRLVAPLCVLAGVVALGLAADVLPGGLDGSWFQRLLGQVAAGSVGVPLGNPFLATLFTVTIALLLLSGWYGPRYLDRFRDEFPPAASTAAARRLYWWALNRGYFDESYDRAVVAPTTALGRALERFDRAVLDRPPPPATPAVGSGSATWEARFSVLRSAHAAGVTALAEPPGRLDWLAAGTVAAVPPGQELPHGAVPRMGGGGR
ncbi:MAG: NADH-quinone oxidoreductase subunit L, partial [Actinomycetota bacterium]|nr:NADH-quinone oxidoreductase subunit L [Actinomycetota bacterium]